MVEKRKVPMIDFLKEKKHELIDYSLGEHVEYKRTAILSKVIYEIVKKINDAVDEMEGVDEQNDV